MLTARPALAEPSYARTDEPLLWLSGSGHEVIEPSSGYYYDCRKRSDAHIGLQLTLSGEGYYERGGRVVALRPGMAFFEDIPSDFRYGYPLHATAPYEHVWLDLQGAMAATLWRQVVAVSGGRVVQLGDPNPVAPLMLALAHQHAARMLADRYQVSARIYEIIMLILALLARARVTTAPLVQGALRAIHLRGRDHRLDVAAIARELHCSREHLARTFTQAIGVSPVQYLLQHRLRLVQEALRDSHDPLPAIASRCGFSSANYLCRAFRRAIGITPMAFRAQPWVVLHGPAPDPAR